MSEQDNGRQELIEQLNRLKQQITQYENFSASEDNQTVKSILNAVPHAIVGLIDRRIVFCNNAVKDVFNMEPDEAIGKTTRIFYRSDEEFEQIGQMVYPALSQQSYFAHEFPCRTKDGKDIICIVSASRFGSRLEKNKIVVMYEDITLRKKQQKTLKDINSLKEALLQQSTLAEKMKKVTDAAVENFDADFARIWLIDEGDLCGQCVHAKNQDPRHICRNKDKCLHLIASSGRYTHVDGETHRRVPFDCYKIGKVASGEDKKFRINDVTTDLRVHNHQWAKELGLVSFAGYQILSNGQTAGVFAVFGKQRISNDLDAVLENMADVAGQIVQASQNEKKIKKQNEFMLNIIESLSHPFYVINVDDYSIAMSNQAAAAAGLSQAKTCYEMTHSRKTPCGETEHICPLDEVQKTKKPVTLEHIHFDSQGNKRFVEVHCYPVFDQQGQLFQAIEYSLDITERKLAEEKAALSAAYWHRTFDAINDMIFIQDLNGVILQCNRAFAEYLQKDPKDIEGKKCHTLVHNQDHPWPDCPMAKSRQDGKIHSTEIFDAAKGMPLSVTTSPIFDEQNRMIGSVHIAKDISREKTAEKDLKRKMHDLEIFRKSAMGRELKMMEMKKRIKELEMMNEQDKKN